MIAKRQEAPIKTFCKLSLLLAVLLSACAPAATTPTTTPTDAAGAATTPAATETIPYQTPTASPIPTQANCTDSALFVADVTIADDSAVQPGQAFTKTWRLRNTGTCTWNAAYTLALNGGDQLASPAAVALTETAPGATLDLSVPLKAPTADGFYTGLYEIRNPQGKAIPIGLTTVLWVKIAVGNALAAQPQSTLPPPTASGTSIAGTPIVGTPYPTGGPTTHPKGKCKPDGYGVYTAQLLTLINTARTAAGVRTLNYDAQLAAAAQAHSDDMACHSLLSHTGSDGSSIYQRILAAGYSPSDWAEIIFGSGSAQQAFDWWMNDGPHRESILDPKLEDFGAGYSYVKDSEYGSYFTVDFGTP